MNSQTQKLAATARMSHLEVIHSRMQSAGMDLQSIKRECSFALQIVSKSPQLQKCSIESLKSAIINVANTGLTLNPFEKLAYLVPRWNSSLRCMEVSLDPSYMGLIFLAAESGGIKSITAQLIYDTDVNNIRINLSDTTNPVTHNINPFQKNGEIVGAYALATFPDGTQQVEYMTLDDIFSIRGRSETYKAFCQKKIKSCTWHTDFGEMTRKTVIKRLIKYLPFVAQTLNHAVHTVEDYAPIEQIPTATQKIEAEKKEASPIDAKILKTKREIMFLLKNLSQSEINERQRELKESGQTFVDNSTQKEDILDFLENYRDDLDTVVTHNAQTTSANTQNAMA